MEKLIEKQKNNLMGADNRNCSKETITENTAEIFDKYIVVHEYGVKTEYQIMDKSQLNASFGIVEFEDAEDETLGKYGFKNHEDSKEKLIDLYKPASEEVFNSFMIQLKEIEGIELH